VWNALAFLAVALALDWMFRRDSAGRARAHLLWSVNPLMLFAVVAGGHIDGLAAALGRDADHASAGRYRRHRACSLGPAGSRTAGPGLRPGYGLCGAAAAGPDGRAVRSVKRFPGTAPLRSLER